MFLNLLQTSSLIPFISKTVINRKIYRRYKDSTQLVKFVKNNNENTLILV